VDKRLVEPLIQLIPAFTVMNGGRLNGKGQQDMSWQAPVSGLGTGAAIR
jgi:hypothetical protein